MKMRSVEFPGEGNRQENAIPTRGKNAKRSPSGTPKPTSGSKPRLWTVKPAPEPYAYWTDPPIARLFGGNQNTPGGEVSRSALFPPADGCVYGTAPMGAHWPPAPMFVSAPAAAPGQS